MKTKLGRLLPYVFGTFCGIAIIIGSARFFGAETFTLRSGEITIRVLPDFAGRTAVDLGPFGDLSWRTHRGPSFGVRFLVDDSAPALPRVEDLHGLWFAFLRAKVMWVLLFGAACGALTALRGPLLRVIRASLIATVALTLVVSTIGSIAAASFNLTNLKSPSYVGPIKELPRMLALIDDLNRNWPEKRKNLDDFIAGLARLQAQVLSRYTPPGDEETVRFLVVSDFHTNVFSVNLGMQIMVDLVRSFDVDAILNLGDITGFGTAAEAERAADAYDIVGSVPHLIVGGNHEDETAMNRLAAVRGVTILEAGTVDAVALLGITILGATDPNARTVSTQGFNDLPPEEQMRFCEALRARAAVVQPQILMTHSPEQSACAVEAASSEGRAMVSLWGHWHRQEMTHRGSVLLLSPGTSGGNGVETSAPFGFALIEFSKTTKQVVSVCLLAFDAPDKPVTTSCSFFPHSAS